MPVPEITALTRSPDETGAHPATLASGRAPGTQSERGIGAHDRSAGPAPRQRHGGCVTAAMTLRNQLLVIGVCVGVAIALVVRRRDRASQNRDADAGDVPSAGSPDVIGLDDDRGAGSAPEIAGISDVDPGPLTQVSAEAIDPEATEEAHEQPRRQRERLPMPGKNLP
jgi:hypothetical protein